MASTNISIRARCHCSRFDYTFSLPQNAFPLKSALCHCNTCRRVTGHLFATFAVIPLQHPEPGLFKDLVKYDSSRGLSRYFCGRCGASICNVETGEWEFCTGILEVGGGLDRKLNRGLLWVGDSGDGGAVSWINGGGAKGLWGRKMAGRHSQDVTDGLLAAIEKLAVSKFLGKVFRLQCKCHCEEVQFFLLRPEGGRARHGAGLCACTSCSKTTGFEISSWAFVPKEKVKTSDGTSWESVAKKLGKYTSSSGVDRYFCRKCGATIFYNKTALETIDVGVGLMRALEGSKAHAWLHWNNDGSNVAYPEDALDKEFVTHLAKGMQERTRPEMKFEQMSYEGVSSHAK